MKLSKQAQKKLVEILSKPQTKKQKDTVKRATGTYAYYKSKWQK